MGNNVNNDFLKNLQETLFNNEWMKELYGKKRAEQQEKLRGVFTVVSENNVDKATKTNMETQAETLGDKVERLEAKMAVLAEELAQNEKEIAKHANEITNLVASAEDTADEMQDEQKSLITRATEDVFAMYKKGQIGRDAIVGEIRRRLEDSLAMKSLGLQMDAILGALDGKKAEVQGLVDSAARWIDQRNILEAQYGATKSAYDMLNATIKQVGATDTTYQNYDLNTNGPIYSPEKVGIVSDLVGDANYNVQPTNRDYVEGSAPLSKDEIAEKYKDYLGTPATSGVDANSYKNLAVQNLGKALDEGLMNDLAGSGMSTNEMQKFLAENFAGANIKLNDGALSIPYGHGADAKAVYDKLIKGVNDYNTGFLGAKNTWDEAGNTISSNDQIAALQKFVENGELAKLANGEPPFTFKEAMYALFDPEKGLFKDSGVVYSLDKQDNIASYFVEFAGDEETANMYKNMSEQIFDLWGVKPSRGTSYEQYDDNYDPEEPTTSPSTPEPTRTDPIWFNIGDKNNKYSFVVDRDNDGAFSGASDFVGGGDATWLEDLKSLDANNDGKLSGDELKELKVLGTEYVDGDGKSGLSEYAFDPKANKNGNKYFRADNTQVNYTIQSAASMGIEEINLANLEDQVGKTTGQTDINNNEIFEDSFTFKMNGQDVTAHRQDETSEFMDAIYGDAVGKNFNIGLNDTDVDSIMEKDYGEFDSFDARFANLFQNVAILKNAGQIAQEARAMYDETLEAIDDMNNVALKKASNRAAAEANVSGWSSVYSKIQQIARSEGIVVDETQAKGIYVLDQTLDAHGVVARYKEQLEMENKVNTFENIKHEAWSAITLVAKNGISPDAQKILEMLENGTAKTAQEVADLLKAAQQEEGINVELVTQEIGFDSEREKAIYEAFNNYFDENCVADAAARRENGEAVDPEGIVVKALAELCKKQIESSGSYMTNKTPEELAEEFLKQYALNKPENE